MLNFGKHLGFLFSTVVFLTGLSTVIFVQLPGNTLFWRELQNSGHTILFAMITLTFMLMIRPAAAMIESLFSKYLDALALLMSVAILTELGQILTHREPSLVDIVRNISGILIGLGVYAFFDTRLIAMGGHRWHVGRVGVLAFTMLVLLLTLTPLLNLAYAYKQRNQAFPLINDFQSGWGRQFINLNQAVLTQVSASYGLVTGEKHSASQLVLKPGIYPGISIVEPFPDWSAYETLSLELYSLEAETFNLVLRIHDSRHNRDYYDRFNQVLTVIPGVNRYLIPLSRVEQAPRSRMMDIERISGVILFAHRLDKPLKIQLGELGLE